MACAIHDLSREEEMQVITPELFPQTGPMRMGEVVNALSEQTDGNAIVVSDVGQHQMFAARYYQFRQPDSHLSSGGLGTMGFALPAAIGAKMGQPDRKVIAIIGDGGFQMTAQELHHHAGATGVKVVILNNATAWFASGRNSSSTADIPKSRWKTQISSNSRAPTVYMASVSKTVILNECRARMLRDDRPTSRYASVLKTTSSQ